MRQARREASSTDMPPRSTGRCYLAFAMGFCLLAALLGLMYKQEAVWAAGLACFALLCLQGACGLCLSRERVVAVVQVTGPLSRTTL